MSLVVIYHRADFDGLFCCEIARKAIGPSATYIGWDYGDPLPQIPAESGVFMLDISVDGMMDYPDLVWIDHHRSAIEKYDSRIPGYRIDGVAACRLAWQWFFGAHKSSKLDFIERLVSEPIAVRLAGEYDIWDKRDPRAELFQHGLRSCDLALLWPQLLSIENPNIAEIERMVDVGVSTEGLIEPDGTVAPAIVHALLHAGKGIQYAKSNENASVIKAYGFDVQFEGLSFLACNHARFNSHLFTAGLKPEHDGCLGFNYDGRRGWRISLYGVPGKPDVDLAAIAVKYGGGGHKQACGFKIGTLPFDLGGGQ